VSNQLTSVACLGLLVLLGGCIRVSVSRSKARTARVESTPPIALQLQNSGTTASLRGLSVVSDRVVWASGSGGTVLRTVDGGATWSVHQVAGADSLDFRDVHGFSADEAVAMATAGRLYRTSDGGRSWRVVYAASDTSVFLDAVSFWDAKHGIVMGDPIDGTFLILLTDDGGESWQELPKSRSPRSLENEAAFAASGTCLTVWGSDHAWFGTGGAGVARVFRSTDRGRSWTAASTPLIAGNASAGIFSVAFENAMNGTVAGGNYRMPASANENLAYTNDGGRTFTLYEKRPPQYLSAIALTSPPTTMTIGVGTAGITYASHSATGWSMLDSAAWNAIGFSDKAGWVVGPDGRVGRINR
jgi:photosystem II stability/assembly factor-like uncharacterized protein